MRYPRKLSLSWRLKMRLVNHIWKILMGPPNMGPARSIKERLPRIPSQSAQHIAKVVIMAMWIGRKMDRQRIILKNGVWIIGVGASG
jgi:hypothetical protein